ncbi:hypothetical protein ACEZCY_03330 [Streptacidiphilus sp. N1-12]|uniref:Secreted protein n=2 Tax=Streptacidiphilus alkalitolerans TaxID=3342712 RepID=A0ABV6V3M7_9ACTN
MARTRLSRSATLATALALALLSGATAATAAVADDPGPIQDPIPVGPNLFFHGLVNGAAANAVIKVGCFGPILPGQTGHPLAGQYVEAVTDLPSSTTVGGYTGSAAHSLVVGIQGASSSAGPAIGTLTSFFVRLPIPTSLNLPCGGTTKVGFTPVPTSDTARASVVTVSLVGEP